MLLALIAASASACGGLIGDPSPSPSPPPRAPAAVSAAPPARPALPHIPDIVVPMPAPDPRPARAPEERPRYWIRLTNEPGIRALGRIENGVAVDILRREPIPRGRRR